MQRSFVVLAGALAFLGLPTSPPTWRATLNPTGGSSIAGTATVVVGGKASMTPPDSMKATAKPAADLATATLNVTGAKPRAQVAWFIYEGKCSAGGGIVGGQASYQPIGLDELGAGKGTAAIPASFNESGSYSVRVHAGASAADPVVACGDLVMGAA